MDYWLVVYSVDLTESMMAVQWVALMEHNWVSPMENLTALMMAAMMVVTMVQT